MNDDQLVQKGISALGARRKMLKHFELIKQELQNKVGTPSGLADRVEQR